MPYERIDDLVHAYSDAVSRMDTPQLRETWSKDAIWELQPGQPVQGTDAIVGLFEAAIGTLAHVIQVVYNGAHTIDEAAGTATGRYYIQEFFQRKTGETGTLLAYYDDEYVRRDGGWRFSSRRLVLRYAGPGDLSGSFDAPSLG